MTRMLKQEAMEVDAKAQARPRRMKRAYVAGPYRAATVSGIRANIESARNVAEQLWRAGFAVFCPHLNSAFMDGVADDSVFLRGGLEWLKWADFVVLAPFWKESEGTAQEILFCEEHDIPVYTCVLDAILREGDLE